ncbi:MAG TPA: heme-binding protein [Streptosporangiaceae bacterium]|jgi:uncharacterized protein GlcG (DUF336 family)
MPRTRRRTLTVSLAAVALAAAVGAGYLVGGRDHAWAQSSRRLSRDDLRVILNAAEAQAGRENSLFRVGQKTRMHIAISDRDGRLLALRSMTDAWTGSIDIAVAQARTGALFSSDQNALSTRDIGILSQAHFKGGSAADEAGPLWGIWNTNQFPLSGLTGPRNGLVTFPGGLPLYKSNVLVGGIGVSGDGVDQDEAVAIIGSRAGQAVGAGGIAGFEAPTAIRSTAAVALLPYTRATPTPQ